MTEIWEDIKGYENRYQVSNLGRVKRLPNGRGINSREQIKSTNRINKETVNHIDGNKQNNCVDNLEWATKHEQLVHAYKLNLKKPLSGTANPISKLTDREVEYIRRTYRAHNKACGAQALAIQFNVSVRTILNAVNHKTYQ